MPRLVKFGGVQERERENAAKKRKRWQHKE